MTEDEYSYILGEQVTVGNSTHPAVVVRLLGELRISDTFTIYTQQFEAISFYVGLLSIYSSGAANLGVFTAASATFDVANITFGSLPSYVADTLLFINLRNLTILSQPQANRLIVDGATPGHVDISSLNIETTISTIVQNVDSASMIEPFTTPYLIIRNVTDVQIGGSQMLGNMEIYAERVLFITESMVTVDNTFLINVTQSGEISGRITILY